MIKVKGLLQKAAANFERLPTPLSGAQTCPVYTGAMCSASWQLAIQAMVSVKLTQLLFEEPQGSQCTEQRVQIVPCKWP